MPRWKDPHAPRSRQSDDDNLSLSGSVGLGGSNQREDVAALQTVLIDAGYLAALRDGLLYDPHDPRFLNAVLLLQEQLGVRQNGVLKPEGPEMALLASHGGQATDAGGGSGSSEPDPDRKESGSHPRYRAVPEGWTLEPEGGPASPPASALVPAQPVVNPWNPIAAFARAAEIGNDQLNRMPGHNNLNDAMRHAEWHRRMTRELGPDYAYISGLLYELGNILEGRPKERQMDIHNNRVGIRAGLTGRPIDPAHLKTLK